MKKKNCRLFIFKELIKPKEKFLRPLVFLSSDNGRGEDGADEEDGRRLRATLQVGCCCCLPKVP